MAELGLPAVTRRQLLARGAAALAAPRSARAIPAPEEAPSPQSSGHTVALGLAGVARGAAPADVAVAVRQAALAIDDLAWLSRGDTVLLKVASNSGNVYPATTDPVAIRAMVELLRERGARRVIVADMSGVQFVRFWKDGLTGSSRTLMASNGIARATSESGAEL